MQDFILLT